MFNLEQIGEIIFNKYTQSQKVDIALYFAKLKKIELSVDSFVFYNAVSAMSSCKIEGESMDIDSFLKYKSTATHYLASLVQKPNDLYNAYEFAQKNKLTKTNFLKSHKILSKHLLKLQFRGKVRTSDMMIKDEKSGRIVYEACHKEFVEQEVDMFFKQIDLLLKSNFSIQETFFYGSLIHLLFVKIHPFDDGNGRAGRLLEKWFLSSKLGLNAWFIQSELNYWNNRNEFYENLSNVGFFYDKLDFNNSVDFLQMLPKSLQKNIKY